MQKEISEEEKMARINQFQQAFVTAAVNYYSGKPKAGPHPKNTCKDKLTNKGA
jgi:hypothetical protein